MLKRSEIVLATICLALVGALALTNIRLQRATVEREFRVLAEESMIALDTRMQTYLQSLQGTLAYLRNTGNPSRSDFEAFVEDLRISTFLPGINGVGFIASIPRENSDAFVQMARRDGYENFEIHPDTTSKQRYVIQHIFPIAPNREAVGLDITFEKGRRETADAALVTGEARMTPRITLVQDAKKKAGFLLLLPYFKNISSGETQSQDINDFNGWVYAPFVGDNLLESLTPAQDRDFTLDVFDGAEFSPEKLIYAGGLDAEDRGKFHANFTIEKFGRPWTLEYTSSKAFDQRFSNYLPHVIISLGIAMTVLLVALLRNIRQRAKAARELVALRERQFQASEEQIRSIADNKVTPVFILSEMDVILSANSAAAECFAMSVEAMAGRGFGELVKENIPLQRTPSHNAEGRSRDGRILALNLQRNKWRSAEGRDRVTAIVRDITSEVTAHEEVRRTKTTYDLALQGSRIGVFEVDLKTGTSEVSATWLDIVGLRSNTDDIDTQRQFLSRIHPDDLRRLQQEDARCVNGEIDRSIVEYRMNVGADNWRWMRSDAIVSERAPDGTASRLLGTQTDITDFRHARNALEASEQQLRQLVTAAPIGMVVLDSQGKFVHVNDAFCRLCGVEEGRLLAKYSMVDFLSDDDIDEIRTSIRAAIQKGSTTTYVKDHPLIQIDGEERWGSFYISWAYNKNADGYYYIAQIIDVTEQKRVERLKSEFVSTVSHELRTPLTSIKGALGLLKSSLASSLTDTNGKLLAIANSNTDRLTAIVNDILDLEKLSSGEVTFHFDAVDMKQLVHETISELGPYAQEHKSTLSSRLPHERTLVHGDAHRLKQVLVNLISNACKFSHADSDVRIIVETINDKAIIYVQNWGPGVPDSFRSSIFKAFSQADGSDTRTKGGTGLGLNISRRIVERHDGQIGFESQNDGPTVFWFTCPISVSNTVKLPQEPQRKIDFSTAPPNVLHIDSDQDFGEIISSSLEAHANVDLAQTLDEAQRRMDLKRYDVVIFDQSVADQASPHFIDELKKHNPQMRVISLSAEDQRKEDSRLDALLVKTRTDIGTIIDLLTRSTEEPKSSLSS